MRPICSLAIILVSSLVLHCFLSSQSLIEQKITKRGVLLRIELEATSDWGRFVLSMEGNRVAVCKGWNIKEGEDHLKRVSIFGFKKTSFDRSPVAIDYYAFLSNATEGDKIGVSIKKGDIEYLTLRIYEANTNVLLGGLINDTNIANDLENKVSFEVTITTSEIKTLTYLRLAIEPTVFTFYYPWYGTPRGQLGRWRVWNTNLKNYGSPRTPRLGFYDSLQDSIIENHFRWASQNGIDVLISSWWGPKGQHPHPRADQAMPILLEKAANHNLKITIYFEGGFALKEASEVDRSDICLNELVHILENYGSHPAFFKHRNKPVIFVYTRAVNSLNFEQWRVIMSQLHQKGYNPVFIMDTVSPDFAGQFDGVHIYNPIIFGMTLQEIINSYELLDVLSGLNDGIFIVTILPGYDDQLVYQTGKHLNRQNGEFYKSLWNTALSYKPNWILITSWNEWLEGTEIEPSEEYGDTYLKITREKSQVFHQQNQ